MSDQHLIIVVTISVVGCVLALGLIASIVNRPATPEHDLRRRVLRIAASIGAVPVGAATLGSSAVAIVIVLAWAAVMIVAFYLVLRAPPAITSRKDEPVRPSGIPSERRKDS